MSAALIALCVGTLTVQNIFTKQYSLKGVNADFTFSAIKVLFAFLFFLFTTAELSISGRILPYSIGFAVTYTIATITSVLAIRTGPLAITSLIMSYSLLIPTLYGFVFLNEPAGLLKCAGIVCLLVSLYLVRNQATADEDRSVSARWLLYVVLAFFSNGLCSVIQNAQQRKFDGAENGNFMVIALFFSLAALVVIALCSERSQIPAALRHGLVWGAAGGICNGATNLLVMLILPMVASSVFFPVLSCGQLLLIFAISALAYREKFLPRQLVGLVFGLAALVMLNL